MEDVVSDNVKQGYVDSEYLAKASDLFLPLKQKSYRLMGSLVGKHVLDIGCGPGLDTVGLAALVGEKGKVDGVDLDPDMITAADELAEKNRVANLVRHQRAAADQLPFADNSFDAVRSERLFMHLSKAEDALDEAIRVTSSGGAIVIVDTDWGSLSTQTGCDDIERRLVQFRAESFLPNGYSGRRLYGMFHLQGLKNVQVESYVFHTTDLFLWQFLTQSEQVAAAAQRAGVLDSESLQQWQHSLENSAKNNQFFASINFVLASGRVDR